MNSRFEILAPVESIHGKRRYLGRRKQGPGISRLVLLTRLPRRLGSDAAYLNELEILTSFRHRNVAAVLELQTLAGEVFLTHELVAGPSLSELVIAFSRRGEPFPAGLLARILHDAALALDDAHHFKGPLGECKSVSHRELSLHSLVLSYEGVTKIIDMGHPRPPSDAVRALSIDLEGLGRLVELSGFVPEICPATNALLPDGEGHLPRPRAFAEAVKAAVGEAMWTEEAAAQFVREQFPRRIERLERLASAAAHWTPPEEPARRVHRSLVALSSPVFRAAPKPTMTSSPPGIGVTRTLVQQLREAPGTRWLRKHAQAVVTIMLFIALGLGLLFLPANGNKAHSAAPSTSEPAALSLVEPSTATPVSARSSPLRPPLRSEAWSSRDRR